MKYKIIFLLVVFTTSFAVNLTAQIIDKNYILHYDHSNGLNASEIYGITQDRNGFIWIGTNNGVFRFDGISFQKVKATGKIKSQIITRVFYEEEKNLLYVFGELPSTQHTLSNGVLTRIDSLPNMIRGVLTKQLNNKELFSYEIPSNTIFRFSPEKSKEIQLPKKSMVSRIEVDKDSLLLISKGNAYWVVDRDRNKVVRKQLQLEKGEFIHQIKNYKRGIKYILTSKYIYKVFKGKTTRICSLLPEFENQRVEHVTFDDEGNIWFSGSQEGLYKLDVDQAEITAISSQFGLQGIQVAYLYADQTGNIWLSTSGYGLYCIRKSMFHHYQFNFPQLGKNINCIEKADDNSVFIGTNSGLVRLNANQNHVSIIDSSNYILSVKSLSPQKITYGYSAQQRPKNSIGYSNEGDTILKFVQRILFPISNDRILMGSWQRVVFKQLGVANDTNLTFKITSRVENIIRDREKILLLSSDQLYEVKDSMLLPLSLFSKQEELIYKDIVSDQKGNLWLATSSGVFKVDASTTVIPLDIKEITFGNQVLCLELDDAGFLWIGTEKGLFRYKDSTYDFFSKTNGLGSDHINALEYDYEQKAIWVGTPIGLYRLNIEEIQNSAKETYKMLIHRVEILNDTLYHNPSELDLQFDQNNLKIHFTGLQYVPPGESRYRYRLTNTKKDWVVSESNQVEYLALASGQYIFEVQCKVAGANWGDSSYLQFTIQPPFWLRWQFIAVAILLLITIVILLVRIRIRTIQNQERKERLNLIRINRLEQGALQANMNPHFIFNSLNSIQNYFVKHKDREAIDFVGEFSTLIRQNMETARKKSIVLNDEIGNLERYLNLEAQRLSGKLEYQIFVSDQLSIEEIEVPVMLIQPFVENAIWHGIAPKPEKGKIELRFELETPFLKVIIKDNGVGYFNSQKNKSKIHISRGIELSKMRLKLLSDQNAIKIEELKGENGCVLGTLVEMRILIE